MGRERGKTLGGKGRGAVLPSYLIAKGQGHDGNEESKKSFQLPQSWGIGGDRQGPTEVPVTPAATSSMRL